MSLLDAHFAVTTPLGSHDCVVKAEGEIDFYTGPQLHAVLKEALADQPRTLTLDMADVTFMDSTGLNALVGVAKQCQIAGVELLIRAPSAGVVRVLELSGLHKMLRITLDPDRGAGPTDLIYPWPLSSPAESF